MLNKLIITKFWRMAKKRVTFTIDEDLDKKIHHLQADFISKSSKSWSYSSVLSMIINEGIRALNQKTKNVREENVPKKHTN
jgi:hypothetical protein